MSDQSQPRVLVTGAGGQLASDLRLVLDPARSVFVDRASVDITDGAAVDSCVGSIRPDVIVNCAAFTAVDQCETDIELAHAVNGRGPELLVSAADRHGCRVLQISTDYVFDGTKTQPYIESDRTNPTSVYGQSKLRGELAMRSDQDLIVRTSWLCGLYGSNMLKTVVRLALADVEMSFVDDQIGHPAFTGDVSQVLLRLLREDYSGICHVTNQGSVSWFEFVQAVLVAMGRSVDQVKPVSTAELDPPRPAPRPANSVLENAALRAWGVEPAPDFRDSLPALVAKLCA